MTSQSVGDDVTYKSCDATIGTCASENQYLTRQISIIFTAIFRASLVRITIFSFNKIRPCSDLYKSLTYVDMWNRIWHYLVIQQYSHFCMMLRIALQGKCPDFFIALLLKFPLIAVIFKRDSLVLRKKVDTTFSCNEWLIPGMLKCLIIIVWRQDYVDHSFNLDDTYCFKLCYGWRWRCDKKCHAVIEFVLVLSPKA